MSYPITEGVLVVNPTASLRAVLRLLKRKDEQQSVSMNHPWV